MSLHAIVRFSHQAVVGSFLLLTCLCVTAQEQDSNSTVSTQDAPIDTESWYPRTVKNEKGTAIIYAPQIDGWKDFETLTAWIAFSIRRTDSEDSYYGSLKFTAKTDTDLTGREVLMHDFQILELSIEGLGDDAEEVELIRNGFTALSRKVPLDLVLEYLPQSIPLDSVEGLNTEPPTIFVSRVPAILVSVDTQPMFLPIEGTGLMFVINTTWDVLRDGEDGAVFLCHDDAWLTAPQIKGDWSWATSLPDGFASIPATPNWNSVRACLPDKLSKPEIPQRPVPVVFYATTPSELLLIDGEPEWEDIGDHGLSYVANTQSELFKVADEHFLLLSGRWFSTTNLDGPWTYTAALPDAFQDIPPGEGDDAHPKSYVRASIPGTKEAWEAALIASIPRTAEIQRGTESALNLDVTYGGEPQFTPIENTGIDMAVNTSYQVLRYEDIHYLCHNATWLTSSSPHGPWTFADSIPDAFATIPPTSPAYNTTFVKVQSSDVAAVNYAYDSGYENAYVSNETVVYGTGYPAYGFSYVYYDGYYPYPYYPYYWWPPTYGYGSWYNPSTGRYGEAVVGYGPYGAAGAAAVYNPETGVYGRGEAVWDSDEFAGRGYAYNPNTDTSIARNRYIDTRDDEGWSERVARRGDEWRHTQSEWQDGRMVTEFESSLGTEGTITRERQGDTVVSEGTVSRGDQQATFESTRDMRGDTMVTEGTITGENRSAEVESVAGDGRYSGAIQGSEGGTGTMDRQAQDGQITGGTTITKDGQTVQTDVTRTAEGVQREFETSGGGQGTSVRRGDSNAYAYQSGSGDVYAGRDGNVYQRTDDGWSQIQNPGSRYDTNTRYDRGSSSYDRSGLNRDYQSRQRGYDRYARHQSAYPRQRMAPRGRRRR